MKYSKHPQSLTFKSSEKFSCRAFSVKRDKLTSRRQDKKATSVKLLLPVKAGGYEKYSFRLNLADTPFSVYLLLILFGPKESTRNREVNLKIENQEGFG